MHAYIFFKSTNLKNSLIGDTEIKVIYEIYSRTYVNLKF